MIFVYNKIISSNLFHLRECRLSSRDPIRLDYLGEEMEIVVKPARKVAKLFPLFCISQMFFLFFFFFAPLASQQAGKYQMKLESQA